jgi:hypothetical protein
MSRHIKIASSYGTQDCRTKNIAERKFLDTLPENTIVIKRGWPDFLILMPNGQVRAVEVKPDWGCNLTRYQIVASQILSKKNINVELWTPDQHEHP